MTREELLNEWVQTIMAHNPSEWGLPPECSVCTIHSKSYDLRKIGRRYDLLQGAVPCLFLDSNPEDSIISSNVHRHAANPNEPFTLPADLFELELPSPSPPPAHYEPHLDVCGLDSLYGSHTNINNNCITSNNNNNNNQSQDLGQLSSVYGFPSALSPDPIPSFESSPVFGEPPPGASPAAQFAQPSSQFDQQPSTTQQQQYFHLDAAATARSFEQSQCCQVDTHVTSFSQSLFHPADESSNLLMMFAPSETPSQFLDNASSATAEVLAAALSEQVPAHTNRPQPQPGKGDEVLLPPEPSGRDQPVAPDMEDGEIPQEAENIRTNNQHTMKKKKKKKSSKNKKNSPASLNTFNLSDEGRVRPARESSSFSRRSWRLPPLSDSDFESSDGELFPGRPLSNYSLPPAADLKIDTSDLLQLNYVRRCPQETAAPPSRATTPLSVNVPLPEVDDQIKETVPANQTIAPSPEAEGTTDPKLNQELEPTVQALLEEFEEFERSPEQGQPQGQIQSLIEDMMASMPDDVQLENGELPPAESTDLPPAHKLDEEATQPPVTISVTSPAKKDTQPPEVAPCKNSFKIAPFDKIKMPLPLENFTLSVDDLPPVDSMIQNAQVSAQAIANFINVDNIASQMPKIIIEVVEADDDEVVPPGPNDEIALKFIEDITSHMLREFSESFNFHGVADNFALKTDAKEFEAKPVYKSRKLKDKKKSKENANNLKLTVPSKENKSENVEEMNQQVKYHAKNLAKNSILSIPSKSNNMKKKKNRNHAKALRKTTLSNLEIGNFSELDGPFNLEYSENMLENSIFTKDILKKISGEQQKCSLGDAKVEKAGKIMSSSNTPRTAAARKSYYTDDKKQISDSDAKSSIRSSKPSMIKPPKRFSTEKKIEEPVAVQLIKLKVTAPRILKDADLFGPRDSPQKQLSRAKPVRKVNEVIVIPDSVAEKNSAIEKSTKDKEVGSNLGKKISRSDKKDASDPIATTTMRGKKSLTPKQHSKQQSGDSGTETSHSTRSKLENIKKVAQEAKTKTKKAALTKVSKQNVVQSIVKPFTERVSDIQKYRQTMPASQLKHNFICSVVMEKVDISSLLSQNTYLQLLEVNEPMLTSQISNVEPKSTKRKSTSSQDRKTESDNMPAEKKRRSHKEHTTNNESNTSNVVVSNEAPTKTIKTPRKKPRVSEVDRLQESKYLGASKMELNSKSERRPQRTCRGVPTQKHPSDGENERPNLITQLNGDSPRNSTTEDCQNTNTGLEETISGVELSSDIANNATDLFELVLENENIETGTTETLNIADQQTPLSLQDADHQIECQRSPIEDLDMIDQIIEEASKSAGTTPNHTDEFDELPNNDYRVLSDEELSTDPLNDFTKEENHAEVMVKTTNGQSSLDMQKNSKLNSNEMEKCNMALSNSLNDTNDVADDVSAAIIQNKEINDAHEKVFLMSDYTLFDHLSVDLDSNIKELVSSKITCLNESTCLTFNELTHEMNFVKDLEIERKFVYIGTEDDLTPEALKWLVNNIKGTKLINNNLPLPIIKKNPPNLPEKPKTVVENTCDQQLTCNSPDHCNREGNLEFSQKEAFIGGENSLIISFKSNQHEDQCEGRDLLSLNEELGNKPDGISLLQVGKQSSPFKINTITSKSNISKPLLHKIEYSGESMRGIHKTKAICGEDLQLDCDMSIADDNTQFESSDPIATNTFKNLGSLNNLPLPSLEVPNKFLESDGEDEVVAWIEKDSAGTDSCENATSVTLLSNSSLTSGSMEQIQPLSNPREDDNQVTDVAEKPDPGGAKILEQLEFVTERLPITSAIPAVQDKDFCEMDCPSLGTTEIVPPAVIKPLEETAEDKIDSNIEETAPAAMNEDEPMLVEPPVGSYSEPEIPETVTHNLQPMPNDVIPAILPDKKNCSKQVIFTSIATGPVTASGTVPTALIAKDNTVDSKNAGPQFATAVVNSNMAESLAISHLVNNTSYEIECIGIFVPPCSKENQHDAAKNVFKKDCRFSDFSDSEEDDVENDDSESKSSSDEDMNSTVTKSNKKKKKKSKNDLTTILKNYISVMHRKLRKSKNQNKNFKQEVFELKKEIASKEDVLNRYRNTIDAVIENTINIPQLAPALEVENVPGAVVLVEIGKSRVAAKLEKRRLRKE